MSNEQPSGNEKGGSRFSREVGAQAARKVKARGDRSRGVWFGLGMMGLVGWSVVVPTLLGAALGVWLDGRYPGRQSWTLMLLVIGLVIGCLNAWHWVRKEDNAMREDDRQKMTMEILDQLLPFVTGTMLGAFFFLGLWWTVQYGMNTKWAGLLFIVSMLARSGVVLFGFYFVSQGHWERIITCVLGFILARFVVRKFLPAWEKRQSHQSTEAHNAS